MAWTLPQLAALEAAIAGGYLTVKYEDRLVTYRSLKDMLALRDAMLLGLGLLDGRRRRILSSYRKGVTP
jgi:hypothetical protein